MPNEIINKTPVDNGEEKYVNILRIQWGKYGAAPDAPEGWVNQGYAMLMISGDDEEIATHYVMLEPDDIDLMLKTLHKIKRESFKPRGNSSERG